jgi:anti-sigma factor RsiW
MPAKPTACDMLAERLSAFLDGDLSPQACRRISAHARRCARCRALTKELRDTIGVCQQAATVPLPPAVRRRARAGIRQLLSRREKP